MHKKLARRLAATVVSVALAGGVFAAVPLSADAATSKKISNYSISKTVAKPTRIADFANGI
jgi:hypothetical protein